MRKTTNRAGHHCQGIPSARHGLCTCMWLPRPAKRRPAACPHPSRAARPPDVAADGRQVHAGVRGVERAAGLEEAVTRHQHAVQHRLAEQKVALRRGGGGQRRGGSPTSTACIAHCRRVLREQRSRGAAGSARGEQKAVAMLASKQRSARGGLGLQACHPACSGCLELALHAPSSSRTTHALHVWRRRRQPCCPARAARTQPPPAMVLRSPSTPR